MQRQLARVILLAVRQRQIQAKADKLSRSKDCETHRLDNLNLLLIEWNRLTLVRYQCHFPSRLAGGKGIGLPSFDVQSFSRGPDTGFIGTNASGNGVLACR